MWRAVAVDGEEGEVVLDTLTLDRQSRYRRRLVLDTDGGRKLLLDLPAARALHDGDALRLQSGGVVIVRAAPEPLIEIRCESQAQRERILWHLGNRHAAVEITPDALFIEPDHVLRDMVEGFGASATLVSRAFEPEIGAYAHRHGEPDQAASA